MKGFMIIGSTYDVASSKMDSFVLHSDSKPFVTEDLSIAVSKAIKFVKSEFAGYDYVEYGHDQNEVYGANDYFEVQCKVIALDGSEVLVEKHIKEQNR